MASSESWWPLLGTVQTVTGKRVSEESALACSAVFAGTRIISETLASLPLHMLEQQDARTTRKATEHPLYALLHDVPNHEMDAMTWLDMQVAVQVTWGNAYSEIQRNNAGEVVALWPIHPSRIPTRNIKRNTTDPGRIYEIQAGQPGELVYWVRNDDATLSPVPAGDMLHIPGVLSSNGITGQSIIKWAANSIGIGMSTEEHAGAFFKNGAMSNMAIKSPKLVSKETAERLRKQWQSVFGGASNHYKTLLLEDGMEPVPLTVNPENTQLILARQFSVTEIARFLRLPPHLLADLSRSSFSNIESENLSFVVHSMLPWIIRWEKAMFRQLLDEREKRRYRFKFNVNGLLRGDTAARAQFYQVMFQLGAFSPNDIRAREDENPIDGGDQYFVPGNNLIPLSKAEELAQAQIDGTNAPPPAPAAPTGPDPDNTARLAELRRLQEELILKVELRDRDAAALADVARKLDELPQIVVKSLPAPPEPPKTPEIDTSGAESLAVREAELARRQTDQAEQLSHERAATDRLLTLAIKRGIDSLAVWEWKAIAKAREAPREFPEWRGKFYSRFRRQFEHEMAELSADAEKCGVVLDLEWGADRYAGESIRDLKSLDPSCADNHHDRVRECTDHFRARQWTERSETLARELVDRGKRLFSEKKGKESQTCPAPAIPAS